MLDINKETRVAIINCVWFVFLCFTSTVDAINLLNALKDVTILVGGHECQVV